MVDHDEIEREILRLVSDAEGDNKAMLLLVYRLHQELIATNRELTINTRATERVGKASEAHTESLKRHAEDEMKLIQQIMALVNQARGGWRVAAFALGLIAVIMGGIQWFAQREWDRTQREVAQHSADIYLLKENQAVLIERHRKDSGDGR